MASLAALALLLTACPEDTPEIEAGDQPEDEAPEDDAPEEADPDVDGPEEATDAEATVATASTDLGEVLVDADGMTLYVFDPDEQGASTCHDECADNWPPLVVEEDPVAGEGADDELLGTSEREDGSLQATYDDWPLYTWVGDQEPGDVNGQGVQDVWWVIRSDGTPVRDEGGEAAGVDEGADADDTGGGAGY